MLIPNPRAATGISGLDDVLQGGFPNGRMYLVEGDPGSGKTTLALKFLLEGVERGEPGVYVALSESREELEQVAASHGWSLNGITICDLTDADEAGTVDPGYTLFHPAEVELSETTQAVFAAVDRVNPKRVAIDSLSEMRLLAQDPLRYRREVLQLKFYFAKRRCTTLMLDYESTGSSDRQLQSLAHGVVRLEQRVPEYGGKQRRLQVQKLRGAEFRAGYHEFNIVHGGLEVYPRLVASEHRPTFTHETCSTGIEALDELLGGGLDRGTATLLMGPAGAGKSTLTIQCAIAAMERGEHVAIYAFDEVPDTVSVRSKGLGMPLERYLERGQLHLHQIDPAELGPGEFSKLVQNDVEQLNTRFVVIDSLNGYQNAMPEQQFLTAHLRELLAYLNQLGVVTFLVMAQYGILGSGMQTPVDLSYLSDTVILMRYFEAGGAVHKAISVVKKRTGHHETTIRELSMDAAGVRVGRQLLEFQGILTGQLEYAGKLDPLRRDGHEVSQPSKSQQPERS